MRRPSRDRSCLLWVFGGVVIGSLATLGVTHVLQRPDRAAPESPSFTATLYRFALNPDKLDRFDDWVRFEHAHHAETVATLEREKMYFEAIFRDRAHDNGVIYWLAVQGPGGGHTADSPLAIDKQYEQFMQETLKKGSRTMLSTEYTLVPPFVIDAIGRHDNGSVR